MRTLLLLFLVMAGPLLAQKPASPTVYDQAVRAFHGGDSETARMLFEGVLATEPNNKAAQNYLRMIKAQQKSDPSLAGGLKKVILPKVELKDATAREAVDFVTQQIAKQTEGKQKLNVVWKLPSDFDARVTLSLQNIPASEALRYIAESAGLQVVYDSYAVMFKPAAEAPVQPASAPVAPAAN